MQNVSAKRKARSASCSDYFDRALVLYNRRRVVDHRRKNVFLTFFKYFGHVFYVFFYIFVSFKRFLFKKTLAKFRFFNQAD